MSYCRFYIIQICQEDSSRLDLACRQRDQFSETPEPVSDIWGEGRFATLKASGFLSRSRASLAKLFSDPALSQGHRHFTGQKWIAGFHITYRWELFNVKKSFGSTPVGIVCLYTAGRAGRRHAHTKHEKVHDFSSFSYSINWEHGPEYAALGRNHPMPPSYFLSSHVSCETNT